MGRDLASSRSLSAQLTRSSDNVTVAATSINPTPDGRGLTVTFPPLSRLGLANYNNFALQLLGHPICPGEPAGAGASGSLPTLCANTYPATLFNATRATPAALPYTIEASATGIVASANAQGRLTIAIRRQDGATTPPPAPTAEQAQAGLYLQVAGADVARIDSAGLLTPTGLGWRVTGWGRTTLELENLIPNQVVTLSLREGERTGASITRSIVEQRSAPKQ
jgi:hypothetical protein